MDTNTLTVLEKSVDLKIEASQKIRAKFSENRVLQRYKEGV